MTIVGDTSYEPDETFTVTIVPSFANAADGVAVGTILNDDAPQSGPTVGIGDASGWQGQTGDRTIRFPVTVSEPATSTIVVHYRIYSGSFTGVETRGGSVRTLTIKPSTKTGFTPVTKFIAVKIHAYYPSSAPDGSFVVQLLDAAGAGIHLGRDTGIGTVHHGNGVKLGAAAAVEGDSGQGKMRVSVTLSTALISPYTVTVSGGGGGDFKAFKPKRITFKPGQVQKFVTIVFYPNRIPQADRTINLSLGSGTSGMATILDDD